MRLVEERIITFVLILLILITLNSAFIQKTNNHINDYYQDILLTENDLLNSGNLALYNYITVLRLELLKSTNVLVGNNNVIELNKKINEYEDKTTKYVELYNIGAESIRIKVDNQPKCIVNINCSNLITILYFIQYSLISIIFIMYSYVLIKINKRIK